MRYNISDLALYDELHRIQPASHIRFITIFQDMIFTVYGYDFCISVKFFSRTY